MWGHVAADCGAWGGMEVWIPTSHSWEGPPSQQVQLLPEQGSPLLNLHRKPSASAHVTIGRSSHL